MTKWCIRNTESSEKHRTPRNMKHDKLVVVKCWSQCITFCQIVFYIISTYYLSSVHTLNLLLRLGVYQFFLLFPAPTFICLTWQWCKSGFLALNKIHFKRNSRYLIRTSCITPLLLSEEIQTPYSIYFPKITSLMTTSR